MSSTANVLTCMKCSKDTSKSQCTIKCHNCRKQFHWECVGLAGQEPEFINALQYTCDRCVDCKDKLDKAYLKQSLCGISKIIEEHFATQRKMIDDHFTTMGAIFENKMNELMASIRAHSTVTSNAARTEVNPNPNPDSSISRRLENIRENNNAMQLPSETEVSLSHNVVYNTDSSISRRLENIKKSNNAMQRQCNRSNIVINGLPQGLQDLAEIAIKIANICNVQINQRDMHHCCYIAGGKSVMVKFNSVRKRDIIMANYYRGQPIFLNAILGNVHSRVYLNDHLTPDASRLMFICRKLRNKKIIKKFKLVNEDVPKVISTLNDGVVKSLELEECQRLLVDFENNDHSHKNNTNI